MLEHLKKEFNFAYTENMGVAYKTTNSALLDFFAQGGALRNRDEAEILRLFFRAMDENPIDALKLLFYFRDVRGGQGERRTFRIIAKHLAETQNKSFAEAFISLIPEYGRWDDVYEFFGTKNEEAAIAMIAEQLTKDMEKQINGDMSISLLAKWLKSENATSKETKMLAKKTRESLGLTPKQYRKMLSKMRAHLRLVENHMCNNEWSFIEYNKVPSKAMFKYREAFMRHDPIGYQKFLEDVKEGKAKINTQTLYPYELVRAIMTQKVDSKERLSLDAMWNNLPDYTKDDNSLVVVDVSGSMFGGDSLKPIFVSISLGIYLAERNKGFYNNYFLTFSDTPELIKIVGNDIVDKVRYLEQSNWGYNTNLQAVFHKILLTAIKNNLPQSEMPERIIIISDMEFDAAVSTARPAFSWNQQIYHTRSVLPHDTVMETIKDEYEAHGYSLPTLVFWNVDARNEQFPMKKEDENTLLVSGMSPAIAEAVMSGDFITPESLMYGVINKERYKKVEEVFGKVS